LPPGQLGGRIDPGGQNLGGDAGVQRPDGAVGDALGVLYVQDAQCVERAAAMSFNYSNPN
jgi:hypothetical protein